MRHEEQLESIGATNISYYLLISNYGYRFDYKGKNYGLRYVANFYGMYLDEWWLDVGGKQEIFNTFEEAIAYLKEVE